jgi:D-aminoacyl-tRNA deacylase
MSRECNVLFVYSNQDVAGISMAKYLIDLLNMEKLDAKTFKYKDYLLIQVDQDIIFTDGIEESLDINPNLIIFLSRHSSTAHIKTLSVHVTGNPLEYKEYGGEKYELAPTDPILMRTTLLNIYDYADRINLTKEYTVTMEVTHHGPTKIYAPSFFVEVGSTVEEWKDRRASKVVVDAVLEAIKNPIGGIPSVGLGGPHYAPTFTRYVIDKDYAVGHILSKYVLDKINEEVLRQSFKKTLNADTALFDWKGIKGGTRRKLRELIEDWGYRVIRI